MFKDVFLALQPEGTLGRIDANGDEYLIYSGLGLDYDKFKTSVLQPVSFLRDPYRTLWLDTLEKEYGIVPDSHLDTETRITRLASIVYAVSRAGDLDGLRALLVMGGFPDAYVFDNDLPVRPDTLEGEYIVNGGVNFQHVGLINVCNVDGDVFCLADDTPPFEDFECGEFDDITEPLRYKVTENNCKVFFVAKSITKNGPGYTTSLEKIKMEAADYEYFKKLILRYKPLDTWCFTNIDLSEYHNWQDTVDSTDIIQDTIDNSNIIQDTVY